MSKKIKVESTSLQAVIDAAGKDIKWQQVCGALDQVDLDRRETAPAAKKMHILPSLSDQEYKTLCLLLNQAYMGMEIKPGSKDIEGLRSRIFRNSASVEAATAQELGNYPFILRMQMVPVIARLGDIAYD